MSKFVPELWNAYPDWRIDTKLMVAEGDMVAVENVMTATFVRDQKGLAVYVVRDAKIVRVAMPAL